MYKGNTWNEKNNNNNRKELPDKSNPVKINWFKPKICIISDKKNHKQNKIKYSNFKHLIPVIFVLKVVLKMIARKVIKVLRLFIDISKGC